MEKKKRKNFEENEIKGVISDIIENIKMSIFMLINHCY